MTVNFDLIRNGDSRGFTMVADFDNPQEMISVISFWISFWGSNICYVDNGEGKNLQLWVANEFINWEHYRATTVYVPTQEGVTRG